MHERRRLDLPCMATPLTGGGRKGSRKEKEGDDERLTDGAKAQ